MSEPRSARIRAGLDHSVIDSDGHMIEFEPAILDTLEKLAGPEMVARYRKATGDGLMQWGLSDGERRERRQVRAPWWGQTKRKRKALQLAPKTPSGTMRWMSLSRAVGAQA